MLSAYLCSTFGQGNSNLIFATLFAGCCFLVLTQLIPTSFLLALSWFSHIYISNTHVCVMVHLNLSFDQHLWLISIAFSICSTPSALFSLSSCPFIMSRALCISSFSLFFLATLPGCSLYFLISSKVLLYAPLLVLCTYSWHATFNMSRLPILHLFLFMLFCSWLLSRINAFSIASMSMSPPFTLP